ncbi:MAG: DUF4835 family protein [Bacteroidales bacterium]|nr:DUF4835 family protein [Bacteroidales bacterium]
MKRIFLIVLITMSFCAVRAQEFRCSVQVNYQKLLTTTQAYESASDKKVFETMKQAIEDFVNGRHWTNMQMEPQEQLDCSVSLILSTRSSATDFAGQLQIQMRRPVYNSTYTTGMFNYMESGNFNFSFNESQPLDFDLGNFYGNLSSTLGYYCYLLLGIYFDSFSPNGGEPFYQLAQQVQQAAEGSGYVGWKSSEGQKSRYWFMENHTNSAYAALHDAYYNYHRLGLDMMTKDQPQARKAIITALRNLQTVSQRRPNLPAVTQFIDVKILELQSIFTPAPDDEKQQVYDLVKAISPINSVKIRDFNKK